MIPKDILANSTALGRATSVTLDPPRASTSSAGAQLTLTDLQNAIRDLHLAPSSHGIGTCVATAEPRACPPGSMTPPLVIAQANQSTTQGIIAPTHPSPGETSTRWLTADGTLDVNVPTAELFQHVVTAPSGQNYVEELARILCSDVYENAGYIYDGSDAYHTCKDLRRSGYDNDIGHDDLLSSSRDYIADNISDWLDETAQSVAEQIRTRMTAGIADAGEVISEIEDHISGEFRSYALTVMEKVAKEWYD